MERSKIQHLGTRKILSYTYSRIFKKTFRSYVWIKALFGEKTVGAAISFVFKLIFKEFLRIPTVSKSNL